MADTDPPGGRPGISRGQRPGADEGYSRDLAKAVLDEEMRENSRRSALWDSFKRLWQRVRGRLSASGGESAQGQDGSYTPGPDRPGSGHDQPNPWLGQGQGRSRAAGWSSASGGGPVSASVRQEPRSARAELDSLPLNERNEVVARMREWLEVPKYKKAFDAGRMPTARRLLKPDQPEMSENPVSSQRQEVVGRLLSASQQPRPSDSSQGRPGPQDKPAERPSVPFMPSAEARRARESLDALLGPGRSVPGNKEARTSGRQADWTPVQPKRAARRAK